MLKIKKITIKNFRSIANLSLDCSEITCFVGNNDAGKSNVLRALNLFFKGHTDYLQPFDFDRDFNKFATVPEKKAKEIVIELVLELPDSYIRSDYPNNVVWKKVWRKEGYSEKNSARSYDDGTEFPARSRIPLLLDRLEYKYIPAIKDKTFFADLQGQLYDVLAQVAESDLRSSASKFETEIQGQIKELLSSVSSIFKSNSFMKLPENLRQVFENLEFNNSDGIPLSRRGDGIKVRHIPAILRFIADKTNSIHKQGVVYHVWGFEEPENNVEMAASFDMVAEFIDAAQHEHQIFLTTHSPVFYGEVEQNKELATVYRVSKSSQISEIKPARKEITDVDLGLAQIVAPYVNTERQKWKQQQSFLQQELDSLKKLNEQEKQLKRLFIEGVTDAKVIGKFISVFYPSITSVIKLDYGGNSGHGSASAAGNRAVAWQLMQQHEKAPVRAALLLDKDDAGEAARESFNKTVNNPSNSFVKPFYWDMPTAPAGILQGFKLPKDLESLYSDDVWKYADAQGWLESRSLEKHITGALNNKIISAAFNHQNMDMFEGVEPKDMLRIGKQFSDDGKLRAAKWLAQIETDEIRGYISNLDRTLKEIFIYLQLIQQ
jgi:predicted ATPase